MLTTANTYQEKPYLFKENPIWFFLDERNRPICLSYYVFQDKAKILTPIRHGVESIGEDPLFGQYDRDSLLNALEGLGSYPTAQSISESTKRSLRPSHCTYLGGATPVRYENYADVGTCMQIL